MVQKQFAIARGGLRLGCLAGPSFALLGLMHAPVWSQQLDTAIVAARPGSGVSQGWQVHPSLSVSEHFTDNVFLESAGAQRAEWTTRVNPAIRVLGNSAQLRFNATYAPELLVRANQGTTDLFHVLNATGQVEILPRSFYVDVRASVSQQNVSVLGPQAESNINTTTNRTSVRTYGISPYIRHEFGADAIGLIRFTNDAVRLGNAGAGGSNTTGFSSSSSNRIDATLTNGAAYKVTTWNVVLSKSNVDYLQSGQTVDSRIGSATVGRLIMPEIRLIGTAGYEDSGYPVTNGQRLEGAFWSVGPEWTPSPRTRFRATFGRRYFGPQRELHFEHRSSRSVWGLDYSDNVTTMRNNLTLRVPSAQALLADTVLQRDPQFQDPVLRQAEVQKQIAATPGASLTEPLNFLTDSLFLERRLQGTFGIQGIKNKLVTGLFASNRMALTNSTGLGADFLASQTVKQIGASLSWSLRVTETLSSNLNLALTRSSFSGLSRTDRLTSLRWSLTKQFGPRVTGSFGLSRLQNVSTVTDYLENSASIALGVRY
jgi:uncharacterized protein (PEP-CTERM system associated)